MSADQSHNREVISGATETEVVECYTEDVRSRVAEFNQHADDIARQIEEFIEVGCDVMEDLKRRFISRMESLKEELLGGVQIQNAQWEESSKNSKDDLERLLSIKELIKSLKLTL